MHGLSNGCMFPQDDLMNGSLGLVFCVDSADFRFDTVNDFEKDIENSISWAKIYNVNRLRKASFLCIWNQLQLCRNQRTDFPLCYFVLFLGVMIS